MKNIIKLIACIVILTLQEVKVNAKTSPFNTKNSSKGIFTRHLILCTGWSCCGIGPIGIDIYSTRTCYYYHSSSERVKAFNGEIVEAELSITEGSNLNYTGLFPITKNSVQELVDEDLGNVKVELLIGEYEMINNKAIVKIKLTILE